MRIGGVGLVPVEGGGGRLARCSGKDERFVEVDYNTVGESELLEARENHVRLELLLM